MASFNKNQFTPSFTAGTAAAPGPRMAALTHVPTGISNPDGSLVMRQNCEIPEEALRDWTPAVLAQNCEVTETYSNTYIRVFGLKTCYQDSDGNTTEPLPIQVKTGPMKIFDLKKVNNEGKPMSMFTLGMRPVGPQGEVFRDFSDNVDTFVRDFVRQHNPDTPKGGKYFKKNPTTMTDAAWADVAEDKIKQNFWTDTTKTRDDGSLWDRIGNVSIWPSNVDNIIVDETGKNLLPENEAFVKGNTVVFTLRLDGIILGQTSIKVRWTVVSGMVTERASAGGYGFTPEFYASTYGNYVSSAPKPNPAIQAMPLPGGNNDTFGGVTFGYSD